MNNDEKCSKPPVRVLDMLEVVDYFGNQLKLSQYLGVTKAAVCYWVAENKIPANRAIQIENLTRGNIRAINLPIKSKVKVEEVVGTNQEQ